MSRGGEIRTPDLTVPNRPLYQAELHPESIFFEYTVILFSCQENLVPLVGLEPTTVSISQV